MVCEMSVKLATPQPIVVGEIGIALGAATAGAVARRAIIGEGAAAERPGEIEQSRRRLDVRQ